MPGPEATLHALHIATDMEELNAKVDPVGNIAKCKPESLKKTMEKMFMEGETAERVSKDDETAYLFYMRFLGAFKRLHSLEMKNVIDFKARMNIALEKCETLADRLQRRYQAAKDIVAAEKRVKEVELFDAIENSNRVTISKVANKGGVNGIVQAEGNGSDEFVVTADSLKTLIDMKSTRFLLIDCRSPADFNSSHPKHRDCISISSVILVKGLSANQLTEKIKQTNPESLSLWGRRASFDLIVLYDWNSSYGNTDEGAPILVLLIAMTEWDPHTVYKGKIKILQGGVRNFYHKYPTYFSNPGTVVDDKPTPIPIFVPINSISYPSLDDPMEQNNNAQLNNQLRHSIPPQMFVDRSTKPSHVQYPHKAMTEERNGSLREEELSSEDKGKQVVDALDDLIHVTKKTKAAEEELNTLRSHNQDPSNFEDKLKQKEKQIEDINQQLLNKTSEFDTLKADYERMIEKERAKRTLPNVRATPLEVSITEKETEKERLAEYVRQIREERKKKEATLSNVHALNNGLPNGLGGMDSEDEGENLSLRTPSVRPSSDEITPKITFDKLKKEGDQQRNNSSLKRSHSNPNLAQSSFEDKEPPTFSRSQKPQSRREFSTISSTQRSHRTGLKNLGNTCYMNSIVQCLSHTRLLSDFLVSEACRKQVSSMVPTRGEVTKEVGLTVQQLHVGHRSIAPEELKRVIGRHHASFCGYGQQDSHELLTLMLDWMHEELNRVKVKVRRSEQKNDGVSDEVAAASAWNDYVTSNDSKISDLFCGEQKSCVRCQLCQKESVTFEPFFILSIPIPSATRCSLNQCIDLYTSTEEVRDWRCVHCNRNGKAEKKIDLWRLPQYLIIHLQRFYNNDGYWRKRINEVDCPLENLDLSVRVKGKVNEEMGRGNQFQLYSISNHYGSMEGGHYTAFCRNNESWTKFDDSDVTSIIPREVCTTAAYILFYSRQDLS